MKKMLLYCLVLGSLCGCSVGMAVSGKPEPNLSVVKEKAKMGEVELNIGSAPVKTLSLPNGYLLCVYKYEVGNTPSPGRAALHGALDVLTLGVWEVIGTPVESLIGQTHYVAVTYDNDDRVVEVKPTRAP